MSHTPAPWRYEHTTKTVRSVPANYWLATMDSWDGAVDHRANANLIAASPDLLAAAQTLVRRIERDNLHTTHGVQLEPLRAAIAKAEGQ